MEKNNTRLNWDAENTMDIELTQGQWTTINCDKYERVRKHRWCAQDSKTGFYVVSGPSNRRISMHRLIMRAPAGLDVDHIDHNPLNNTTRNLRLCSHSQNLQHKRKDRRSAFKGVSLHKPSGKYLCHIVNQHLGLFDDAETAGLVYDIAAELLYGEFAVLNRHGMVRA